jgi:hypothetical protein
LEHLQRCDLECEVVDLPASWEDVERLRAESVLLAPYRHLLAGVHVWDAHSHVGCDIDATRLSSAAGSSG